MRSQCSMISAMLWSIRSTPAPCSALTERTTRRELRDLGLGKTRGGLVHQHERRLGGERPRDAEPPLVAVRERRRRHLGVAIEPELGHQRVRAPGGLARSGADTERRDLDVLAHREVAERPAVLERAREAVAAAAMRRPACDVALPERDRALVGTIEAAEHVDERRLAGAVRPDQPDDLAAAQARA